MLRVFKPGSPMSLGIWGLLAFSGCAIATASRHWISQPALIARVIKMVVPNRPILVVGSLLATFIGGYTGVLLTATSVPLWSRSRFLAPTFLASSLSSGAAAIGLGLAADPNRSTSTAHKVEQVKLLATGAEVVTLIGFLRETGFAARPVLGRNRTGYAFLFGAIGLGIIGPLVGALLPGKSSRGLAVARSLATLFGSVCLRYAIVEGGRASAADPNATFRHTDKKND
jgi:formate-dependent nitrite reductase membrane component NrfD